ncbi:MAG TPA: PAS domain-containing sensor histidine kinase [Oculatellaceae cyanobacterium]|jgi:PAS domain S-box-containing protein
MIKPEDYKQEQLLQELSAAHLRVVELEGELQRERCLVNDLLDTTDTLIRNFVGAVMDLPSTLVVILDPKGRIFNCNPIFAKTTLYSLAEIKGKYIWEIFDLDENIDQLQIAFKQINASKHGDTHECFWKTKNGQSRYICWSYINIYNPDGSVAYILANGIDLTEKKQAEVELIKALQKEQELNELKSSFISIASHEFRTPLTSIMLSIELMQKFSKNWSEEKRNETFNRMKTRIKSLSYFIDDVLVISKAESPFEQFNPKYLNLKIICDQIVEEIQNTSNTHKIIFNSKKFPDLYYYYVDENLLCHILSNLLSNAIKYSPQASTVDFEIEEQSEQLIFKITDYGIGIPVEDQKLLFNSFYRASNAMEIPGTGLGLSIVKKMVELHGGQIDLESKLKVGTTFKVSIPLNKSLVLTEANNALKPIDA